MRLIDADVMHGEIDKFNPEGRISLKNIKRYIDVQPTAYNIDKVVKQLKKVSFVDVDEEYADNGQIMLFLQDAIEIVKKGGSYVRL